MRFRNHWVVQSLAILSWILWVTSSSGQSTLTHTIGLTVIQTPTDNHGVVYGLNTGYAFFHLGLESPTKLIAPDGTEFGPGARDIERSTFEEIATVAFGDWTALARINGVDVIFSFRFEPFALNDVFTDIPIITSPLPGSNVPPHFIVRWNYENGSMPSRRGASLMPSSNIEIFDSRFVPGAEYAFEISTRFKQPGPGTIAVHTNTATTLPTPAFISRPPSLDGHRFNFISNFRSQSAAATYRIIPEPKSCVLASFVIAFAALRKSATWHGDRHRRVHC
jgi:hypothetical protein